MSKPKILQQIDNADKLFVATHSSTTYAQVKAAYDAGKDIILIYSNRIYDLTTIPTGSNTLYFYDREYSATNNNFATTTCKYITLTSGNVWSSVMTNYTAGTVGTQLFRNTTTEISSTKGYYRPIRLSTAEPTSSDGFQGDIWIQYEE